MNVLAFLAQHLIVLLDPAEIVDMHEPTGVRNSETIATQYSTAVRPRPQISRGVLIHGAQGVRSVWVMPPGAFYDDSCGQEKRAGSRLSRPTRR